MSASTQGAVVNHGSSGFQTAFAYPGATLAPGAKLEVAFDLFTGPKEYYTLSRLPDRQDGFTLCRLRYRNVRRARKSGWGDDYPNGDYNFLQRLSELTTIRPSHWNNGNPGFSQFTAMDPDLFHCPVLRLRPG